MRGSHRAYLTAAAAIVLVAAACGADAEDVTATATDEPTDTAADDPQAAADAAEDATEEDAAEEVADASEPSGSTPVEAGSVTAYVVGYHWGYAVFEEDGTELDVLEVPVGTEVELVAVNDHASEAISRLPDAVVESIRATNWHDRAHEDLEAGHLADPELEVGMSLSDAISAAHDGHDHTPPQRDHGLMVTGVGVDAYLDAHADEPERLVFTVEREGVHRFRCNVECGAGHESQSRELLVVTA